MYHKQRKKSKKQKTKTITVIVSKKDVATRRGLLIIIDNESVSVFFLLFLLNTFFLLQDYHLHIFEIVLSLHMVDNVISSKDVLWSVAVPKDDGQMFYPMMVVWFETLSLLRLCEKEKDRYHTVFCMTL